MILKEIPSLYNNISTPMNKANTKLKIDFSVTLFKFCMLIIVANCYTDNLNCPWQCNCASCLCLTRSLSERKYLSITKFDNFSKVATERLGCKLLMISFSLELKDLFTVPGTPQLAILRVA